MTTEVTDPLRDPMTARRGVESIESAEQSLGGEDLSWCRERVCGAMACLGVRAAGESTARDLHQSDFDADWPTSISSVELFTAAALLGSGDS